MMRAFKLLLAVALTMGVVGLPSAQADSRYRQPVWFQWNFATLDTLVIPPGMGQLFNGNGVLGGEPTTEVHPLANSYQVAIEESIEDWHRAIDRWAPKWFKKGFTNNVYILGKDTPPIEAIQGVDILVTADLSKPTALGVAVRVGAKCVVANSRFFITSMSDADMYNINAQEYGHCLGLAHVNEAAPANPGDTNMRHDPMNGLYDDPVGNADNHRHCISNLNVKGLLEVFRRPIKGNFGALNGVIPKTKYEQTNCE